MRITKDYYNRIIAEGTEAEKLLESEKRFRTAENKFKVFKCDCGKTVRFNGITSHSKVCEFVVPLVSLKMFEDIVSNYDGGERCVVCDNIIPDIKSYKRYNNRRIHTCSSKCRKILVNRRTLKNHVGESICEICGEQFYWKDRPYKTCSDKCNNKLASNNVKNEWSMLKNNNLDKYKDRCRNIGSNRVYISKPAWNKGLTGEEYLSHYLKEDGTNTLYEGLKKNDGWFKASTPELIFKEILEKGNYRYQHSFFTQGHQYDFLLSFNKNIYIIEIDGDYWHKSSRIEPNADKRKIVRLADKLKADKIKNIKNTNKKWHVIRFWEIDLYNEPSKIAKYMSNLKEFDYDQQKVESEISKINSYYEENS